jgi:hypothetical protein
MDNKLELIEKFMNQIMVRSESYPHLERIEIKEVPRLYVGLKQYTNTYEIDFYVDPPGESLKDVKPPFNNRDLYLLINYYKIGGNMYEVDSIIQDTVKYFGIKVGFNGLKGEFKVINNETGRVMYSSFYGDIYG